jgi:hypothetical protein
MEPVSTTLVAFGLYARDARARNGPSLCSCGRHIAEHGRTVSSDRSVQALARILHTVVKSSWITVGACFSISWSAASAL